MTFSFVSGKTVNELSSFNIRDTVAIETFANSATSFNVAILTLLNR